jgi:hypothetical protein
MLRPKIVVIISAAQAQRHQMIDLIVGVWTSWKPVSQEHLIVSVT